MTLRALLILAVWMLFVLWLGVEVRKARHDIIAWRDDDIPPEDRPEWGTRP